MGFLKNFRRQLRRATRESERVVPLSMNSISKRRVDGLSGPAYNGIVDDLIAYTGFSTTS